MTNKNNTTLLELRQRIDAIDDQILALVKERLRCAKEIGQIKAKDNLAKWDPQREREIIDRILQKNAKEFPDQPLRSIFNEIITTCRLSQKEIDVAYLGPEATFSHLAGVKYFGHAATYKPIETIQEIFIEVERSRIQYGIVPVENSIEGAVTSSLDAFMNHRVKICGEELLAISHNLINQSGDISDPSVAAIASSLAIKTYQLQVVVKGVEDYSGNTTRFVVIGQNSPSKSGKDKTSLLVGLMDQPGALNNALNILAERNINLTKIESRPAKGEMPWNYLFFIDMLGHMEDENVKVGCDRLRKICSFYEWLGSYPQAMGSAANS